MRTSLRSPLGAAIALLALLAALASVDAGYQVARAIEDARVHCHGTGIGGEACRAIRRGFVHTRLIAALDGFAAAAVAGAIAGALAAWRRSRRRPA